LQVDIQHMGIMHALQAVVKIIDKFWWFYFLDDILLGVNGRRVSTLRITKVKTDFLLWHVSISILSFLHICTPTFATTIVLHVYIYPV
jgi:hypothetical protein